MSEMPDKNLYQCIVECYQEQRKVAAVVKELHIPASKVRRVLITEGLWSSPTSRKIAAFLSKELKKEEIESLYGYIDNPSNAAIFVVNPKNYHIFSSIIMNEETTAGVTSLVQNYDLNKFKYGHKKYSIVRNSFDFIDEVNS